MAFLLLAAAAFSLAACAGNDSDGPAPPVEFVGPASDLALSVDLPASAPRELPGLHNVYRLSDAIVSGSEPENEAAFAELAALGIRTILCVDGKVPDAEAAARHGMTYVHLPLQYRGITDEQQLDLAKTFREQEAPFYVHCFHGQHRGPAAAAIGRVVLDGASRATAVAEMAQWSGTSPQYEGLYDAVARADLPDADDSAGHDFDFPAAHPMQGVRASMVPIPRTHDALELVGKAGWAVDPGHPDIDPLREAEVLAGLFAQLAALDEVRQRPDDFRGWADDSRATSAELVQVLRAARQGRSAGEPVDGAARARADALFADIKADCKSCHAVYRN